MAQIGHKNKKNELDSMQQHSGEHIMSAIFKRDYGVNILSFHLGDNVSYIDINRCDLTASDFCLVENLVNDYITQNYMVTVQIYQKEDLSSLPLRKMLDRELPYYRVVRIGDLDCCLCAGDHVEHTGEIGILKIINWERKKDNLRVYFVCGSRALADYQDKASFVQQVVQDLSLDSGSLFATWGKYLAKIDKRDEELKNLKLQINQLRALDLLKTAGEKFCVPAKFENCNAQTLSELARTVLELSSREIVLLLASKEDGKTNILISANKEVQARDVLKKYLDKYNGKGGGNSNTAQGSIIMDVDVDTLLEEIANDCFN